MACAIQNWHRDMDKETASTLISRLHVPASLLNLPCGGLRGVTSLVHITCMESVGDFFSGGIYLMAGPPGSRKSGLALQVVLDLGKVHRRSLYLMTEEPSWRLRERA